MTQAKPLCFNCALPEEAHPTTTIRVDHAARAECMTFVPRPVPQTHCDTCKRRLWNGGHALNPEECDRPDGETCKLYETVGRMARGLNEIRKTIQEWNDGQISKIERESRLREAVRRGLDESLPHGVQFMQSWCGGEESTYARLFEDRNRLLRERDAAVTQHGELKQHLDMYKDQWRSSIEKDGRQIHEAFRSRLRRHWNEEAEDLRAEIADEQKRSAALMELVQAFVHCDYTGQDIAPVAHRARTLIAEEADK